MTWWLPVRLSAAVLVALLAVHLVVLLNNRWSWMFTLLASEYGHRLALLALLLLPVGFLHTSWVSRVATALLLISVPVLLLPLMQARGIAARLPEGMRAAFSPGKSAGQVTPFRFRGFWFGDWQVKTEPIVEHLYTGEGREPLKLLFHAAAGRERAPCIVVLHGGGWQNGSPEEFPKWSAYWAQSGYAVAAIQYRLAPKHRWPEPKEDVEHALKWLKENAGSLGIDASSFILLGRSAGGQIAMACAYGLKDPAIIGCVSIYGPADLIFARRFAFSDDVLNSLKLLREYLGGDPEQVPENYISASSYFLADARSCPTLLIHGTRDVMVWNMQSRRLAEKLKGFGVPHYLLELPWGTHGFDWPFDSPGGQLTRYAVDEFLKATCERRPTKP